MAGLGPDHFPQVPLATVVSKLHHGGHGERSLDQSRASGIVLVRHTGEGRCPWLAWVPAFAGKTGIMTVLFLSDPSLWVRIRT